MSIVKSCAMGIAGLVGLGVALGAAGVNTAHEFAAKLFHQKQAEQAPPDPAALVAEVEAAQDQARDRIGHLSA